MGVVGILLSRSTSILEISDSNGLTSLHVAAKNGHYEMVENLLGQGSDLNSKDKVNITIEELKDKNFLKFPIFCMS